MAFDSKYFTGTDSSSYFTESSKMHQSSQGFTIGEDLGFGANPLSSASKAIQHGFQTVMMGMDAPGQGRGQEGLRNIDRISPQQLDATAEMLRLNKMNFITHGPLVDLLGVGGESGKEQGISSQVREENLRLFEKTIENTDKMAQQADLKNIPITIHPPMSLGPQDEWFNSGYKDNDGNIIYGRTGSMIKKDDGKIIPMQSSFKWLPMDGGRGYEKKENTEDNGYALFEITPEKHLEMANSTALSDIDKKIADIDLKLNQFESINMKNSPGYNSLITERNTLEADRLHLTNPKYSIETKTNIFVKATDYAQQVIPEQINRLAMASYKTKTQPVLAIENLFSGSFGSPKDVIDIVSKSREEFAKNLQEKEGLSWSDAESKANELIGLTIDIGHLNTFKSKINPETGKYWNDDDLKKEAEKMAKTGVKLVHIADNIGEFGKDSHLMLGRGNAKIDEMMDILKQNGFQGQAAIESYEGEGDFDKNWARNNIRALGSMYESGRGPSIMDVDMSNQYAMRSSNYGHK
ncbi:MAG: TIM barrel protein, partial [Candidatus Nanoarchaeia archaeon]|nr:TIM barrel protein [Candidatus Nanoarchaeia archaeon]